MAGRYPVLVDLDGRRCLVVGGGTVAARKVRGLLAAGARVTVVAPDLHPDLVERASAEEIEVVTAPYGGEAATGPDAGDRPWAFVVAATDDPALNATVAADAARAGTWANDATDPRGGVAALPAVHRDGPITVTVATGGAHPGAARWLLDRLVAGLGPEHAVALALLDELALRSGEERHVRPDWQSVADSGTLEAIRAGHVAEAKERLQACLSSSSD